MERELNQKLIEKLRNKEIWLHYGDLGSSGDLEGLRLVIKTAFPDDKRIPGGTANYYRNINNHWDGTSYTSPAGIPVMSLIFFISL